jgi:hypothetical protein
MKLAVPLAGLTFVGLAQPEMVLAQEQDVCTMLAQRLQPDVLQQGSSVDLFTQLRVRFKSSSRVTKLSQHQTDGGKFQERESIAVEILPVLGEAAASVEPRNRAFDNPTLG